MSSETTVILGGGYKPSSESAVYCIILFVMMIVAYVLGVQNGLRLEKVELCQKNSYDFCETK